MSSSKSRVTISIANRQGEVEIIDGQFHVLRRGIGEVTENLSPGIYKARTRVGTDYQDKLFVVEPDAQAIKVEVAPVPFPSALPLHFTTTSHEFHQAAVQSAFNSQPIDIGLGIGSRLFIIVRDPSDANRTFQNASDAERRNYERSFEGFRLRSTSGTLLADVDEVGQTVLPLGYKLLNAHASAEPRVLTLERDGMSPIAMPLPMVAGWQTQVFVNVDVPPELDTVGKPLLADRSLMMAPLGSSFYPSDEHLRLAEVARAALQAGRSAVSEEQMQRLLQEKFSNPILGLFGAYLLLAETKQNLELLSVVIRNVGYMIGEEFPDVLALRMALTKTRGEAPGGPTRTPFPPLLHASWNFLAQFDTVMPRGSLNRIVATNAIETGVWLSWIAQWPSTNVSPKPGDRRSKGYFSRGGGQLDARSSPGPSIPATPESIATQITRLARRVRWIESLTIPRIGKGGGSAASLSSLQRSLLQTIQLVHSQLAFKGDFTSADAESLCASLGLPLAVVSESVTDLARLARVDR